jgi:hypothetical protein
MQCRSILWLNCIITIAAIASTIGCVNPVEENDTRYSELESVWQYLKAYSIYQWDDSTSIPDDPFVFKGPQELMAAIPDTFTGSDGTFGRYTEYVAYNNSAARTALYSSEAGVNIHLSGNTASTITESITVFLDTLTDSTVLFRITSFHSGEIDYNDKGSLVQWDKTSETFSNMIRSSKPFPFIIIDLRGNGGGSIDEAINIVEAFLPYGTDFLKARERKYDPDSKTSRTVDHFWTTESSPFPELGSKKITILMNKRTASSSEILVAALKDCREVTLAGDTSYGKGIGQILLQRHGRPTLKITYLQMSGISSRTGMYHHKGIAPDVYIPNVNSDPEKTLLTAVQIHEPDCISIRIGSRINSSAPSPVTGYRVVYE